MHAHAPAAPTVADDLPELDLAERPLADELRLEEATLVGVATGAPARSVTIADCRLRATLRDARLHDLHVHDVEAVGADLANLDARGGALTRVLARLCRWTGAQLVEASLRDVTFADCRLEYAVLAGARLDRVVFRDCDLRDVSLEQTQLRDVRFERCDLSGAALGQSRLLRVELVGCRLEDLRSVADLRGAAMPWPDLVGHAGTFAAALGIGLIEDDEQP